MTLRIMGSHTWCYTRGVPGDWLSICPQGGRFCGGRGREGHSWVPQTGVLISPLVRYAPLAGPGSTLHRDLTVRQNCKFCACPFSPANAWVLASCSLPLLTHIHFAASILLAQDAPSFWKVSFAGIDMLCLSTKSLLIILHNFLVTSQQYVCF